tara:strand:- start:23 stop:256 length:234 start_codon:yes stop_codon:yes gene_type:complete
MTQNELIRLKTIRDFLDTPFQGDMASQMFDDAMNWQMTGECECQQRCDCEYHYGEVTGENPNQKEIDIIDKILTKHK